MKKLSIITEEKKTLKKQAAQLQARIATYEPCHLKRQIDAERATIKRMQDEDKKKSKKVDNFETQMKRMEAMVKESKCHTKEEEKKKKVADWNVQDAIRRVEAANWQKTILEKKVKNVPKS